MLQEEMRFAIVGEQSFFVRACYPALWAEACAWFESCGEKHNVVALVTGTPGIGKSSFLVYAVHEVCIGTCSVNHCFGACMTSTDRW